MEGDQVMKKELRRSSTDCTLCGVCGGIAEYCGVDSTLVRVGFALFAMACGSGILAYILAAVIIPRRSAIEKAEDPQQ